MTFYVGSFRDGDDRKCFIMEEKEVETPAAEDAVEETDAEESNEGAEVEETHRKRPADAFLLDEAEAAEMLSMLQGTTHQVYTGVSIVVLRHNDAGQYIIQPGKRFYECTDVTFYPMTDREIQEYVSTKDCMDKAGAYGIQSGAARYIEKIDGDYNNVVGLPIARLYQELKSLEDC